MLLIHKISKLWLQNWSTSSINLLSKLVTLTTPTQYWACNSQTLGCHTLAQSPSSLPCHKSTPYKVRAVFSKPVYAVRARGGPPSTTMTVSQPSVGMSPVKIMTLSQSSPAATMCMSSNTNHDSFTANPSSNHVHVTLQTWDSQHSRLSYTRSQPKQPSLPQL